MDSMYSMIDILITCCGLYVLYTWYLLKFKGEIKESLLLPKDVSVKKCKDKAAYIAQMSWKVLIYGCTVLVCGILGILGDVYGMLQPLYLGLIAVFVLVTVWFAYHTKKAVKQYW